MTNKDDILLPAGYEDWVEVSLPEVLYSHLAPLGQSYLRVSHGLFELHMDGAYREVQGGARYFVPPKPKPVLPDVKPGAVLRYTDRNGRRCQAVRRDILGESPIGPKPWTVTFRWPSGECADCKFSDMDLLGHVNTDGFTVELDGL